MSAQSKPDSLVNVLIQNKTDGTVKRVIRDDGLNGYHISDPETPTLMKPISLEEFQSDWELYATVEQQLKDNGPEVEDKESPFGLNMRSIA